METDKNIKMKLRGFLDDNHISYDIHVDLKKKTWIHRGGVAACFIQPSSIDELEQVVRFCYTNKVKFDLVGHTSNLYFLNSYNPEVVISTAKCRKFKIDDNIVLCDCGAKVSTIAKSCVEKGVQGFEYLTTLPGTIGGAVYNNSTCRENGVASLIEKIEFLDSYSNVRILSVADMGYAYRTSVLKEQRLQGVILKVHLKVNQTNNPAGLLEIAKKNEAERKLILEGPAQNLGCTFDTPFINGEMPRFYYWLSRFHGIYLRLFYPKSKRQAKSKNFLLTITGYRDLIPYISDKLMITYIWKDEKADELFPRYVEFMGKILKTDKMEIEIKKD